VSGYSGTPLWKKLGYKPGTVALVVNPPASLNAQLALPADVKVTRVKILTPQVNLIHHFSTSKADLQKAFATYRARMESSGALWISWPKKTSGIATDLTENVLRELALPLGFVDVKVCAVDETWSGLKFVVRKTER